MTAVACIVEGHSEVVSLPILLERLNARTTPERYVTIARPPVRVSKDGFLNKESDFVRYLRLAAAKVLPGEGVLVLLDADKDCPATRGPEILERARSVVPDRRVSVVLANREYEAWLIAGAGSLARVDRSADDGRVDPDAVLGAKAWLDRRMSSGYNTRVDQPRLTSAVDLDAVERDSRSFRKLAREWSRFADRARGFSGRA